MFVAGIAGLWVSDIFPASLESVGGSLGNSLFGAGRRGLSALGAVPLPVVAMGNVGRVGGAVG